MRGTFFALVFLLPMGCVIAPRTPAAMGLAGVDAACAQGDAGACERMTKAYGDARTNALTQEHYADFTKLVDEYRSRACNAGSRSACSDLLTSADSNEHVRIYGVLCAQDIAKNAPDDSLISDCYEASRDGGGMKSVRHDDRALDEVERVCNASQAGSEKAAIACNDAATLLDGRDPELRFRMLTKACNREVPSGLFDGCEPLGEMYEKGLGTSHDTTAALSSYDRACVRRRHQPEPVACQKALDLRIRLCDGGDMAVCTALSDDYRFVDPLRAKALLTRACDAKYAPACKALDAWLGSGAAGSTTQ